MTILSITNPLALPPLPEPAQDPALQAQKADPLTVQAAGGAKSGSGAGLLSSYSGGQSKPFQRAPDATQESIIDARVAEQDSETPEPVDTIKAARETAASLPVPIPTSPLLRDAMIESAKQAAAKDALEPKG